MDPARDLERLDLEFILADLAMVDRRLERLGSSGRHGTPAEREANEREEVDPRAGSRSACEAGHPIRDAGPRPTTRRRRSAGFRFLTEKPVLVLLNVGEGELAAAPRARRAHRRPATRTSTRWSTRLSAKIEMELGELEPDEAAVVHGGARASRSPGLDRVIDLSYRLLGLISFLTAGPDEVRAWPIPDGSTAVDAAGRHPHGPRQGLHPRRDRRPTRTC